jgi:anti-sigma factor RsiW
MSVSFKRRLLGFLQQNVPLMITCKELEEFIADYVDDTLPKRQLAVFRIHLLFCRECRDYLAGYLRTIDLGRAVFQHPHESVSQEVPEDLVRAILDAKRASED